MKFKRVNNQKKYNYRPLIEEKIKKKLDKKK